MREWEMKSSRIFQNLGKGAGFFLLFALAKLLLHIFTNATGGFGLFRDELYYLACADHLALGYVDQPPLSIFVLAGVRGIAGDSLFVIRFLPAVIGSAVVFLAGLITREMGGRLYAQALAMLASIVSLIHLAFSGIYSMNIFDLLVWALAVYILLRLVKTEKPALWILLGVVLGLGLLNKISTLWLGAGIAAGLVLTRQRKWLKTPWPYLTGIISGLLFLPYIFWNLTHGWAHLEFIRNATAYKYAGLNIMEFLKGQVLLPNPVTLPLWLGGLFFLLFQKRDKSLRFLGFLFLIPFLILIINQHSKPEYLAAAYVIPFAGGGILYEKLFSRRGLRWKKPLSIVILISGLALTPYVLPILSQEATIRYMQAIGLETPNAEGKRTDSLPQHFADMHGWENMASVLSKVYLSLEPEEREKTVIFGRNYGEAAAVDYYRKKYDLPTAISPHNNYWIWGCPEDIGTAIIIGGTPQEHESFFGEVNLAAVIRSSYAMPYETDLPVYIARKPKLPLSAVWDRLKNFS